VSQAARRHVVLRWAFGMVLVSWRYLWATTPLRRTDDRATSRPQRLGLPADVDPEGLLLACHGVGPLFHRLFRADILDARQQAEGVMGEVINMWVRSCPSVTQASGGRLANGLEIHTVSLGRGPIGRRRSDAAPSVSEPS
jgi:hypothetical protein